ncbi:hypothetical protein GALL_86380 [mine drainage metagenome]|uniref:Sel1 repeat protein n=1 Tax=mine drainage metagenome TaxID=410659 RepID=A0A1J5SYB4_9ZZZZ
MAFKGRNPIMAAFLPSAWRPVAGLLPLLLLAACARPPGPAGAALPVAVAVAAPPSLDEAVLRRAAELGDAGAQTALGKLLLQKGSYFEPAPAGVDWLEKAAGQGSGEARLALAYRYRAAYCGNGPLARRDKCEKSRRWFRAEAETGDVEAMTSLVFMLPRPPFNDPAAAYYWALVRERQQGLPPTAWVEDAACLKAGLPGRVAQAEEGRANGWQVRWARAE